MNTMNIALPTPLKDFVLQRVDQDGYSSASEYMRELIRGDQKKRATELLEQEILKGAASPEREMTRKDWSALHARLGKKAPPRRARTRS